MSEEALVAEVTPVLEPTVTPEPVEAAPEKTFTQSELDSIVSKRLAKESRKLTRQAELETENRVLREQVKAKEPAVSNELPKPEDYATTEEYLDARAELIADRKIEAKLAEREEKESARKESEIRKDAATKWQKGQDAISAKYPDYEEAVDSVDHIKLPGFAQIAIMESDVGHEIAYYLAKNPDELEALVAAKPHIALMKLGKLEDKLSTTAAVKKIVTKAPEPITPLRGKSGLVSTDISDADDMKTFMHKRNIQLGRIK